MPTASVEVIEAGSPLVFHHKEYRPGSGGEGRQRGGLGQRIEVGVRTGEPFVVSSLADRLRFPDEGYQGGGPGALASYWIGGESIDEPKLSHRVEPDQTFVLELPGGGGFGPPSDRDPGAGEADLREGLIPPSSDGDDRPT